MLASREPLGSEHEVLAHPWYMRSCVTFYWSQYVSFLIKAQFRLEQTVTDVKDYQFLSSSILLINAASMYDTRHPTCASFDVLHKETWIEREFNDQVNKMNFHTSDKLQQC